MSNKEEESKKIQVEGGDNYQQDTTGQGNPETAEPEPQTVGEAKSDTDDQEVDAQPTADATDETVKLQQQVDELKDQLLRKAAEFDNYRKRTLKEKAELILNGGEKTILAILPVLDDFERALKSENDDAKSVREGIELIHKKFVATLESLGVKRIETEDKDFNTDTMEAIAMVPGMGDDKKGKVVDCTTTGYTLNDKVIRHAKVAVGQ